jgi:cardiolipin synthase
LINGAQTSLDIYNEEMQDPQIISALEIAAKRGVDVEVDMTYAANWKTAFTELSDAGVKVRTYPANAPIYIHAKVVIADDTKAFVGSENFSSASLDQNRELGLIISDPATVASLAKTFAQDWKNATPFLVQ